MMICTQFIDHGIPFEETNSQKNFEDALSLANQELEVDGFKVIFHSRLPEEAEAPIHKNNLLLALETEDGQELIDMLDLKALDELSLKPVIDLKEEIVKKVHQHVLAKTTPGILISTSGSKIDIRKLNLPCEIDSLGYLKIDHKRIAWQIGNSYHILKAQTLRNYTILRIVHQEDKLLRLFDEYDLVRYNRKGTFIDLNRQKPIDLRDIRPESLEDAKCYEGDYLLIERDILTDELKDQLRPMIETIESP